MDILNGTSENMKKGTEKTGIKGTTTVRNFVFSQLHSRIQTIDGSGRRKIREVHCVQKKKNLMNDDFHGHLKQIGVSPGNDVASQTWSIRRGTRRGVDTALGGVVCEKDESETMWNYRVEVCGTKDRVTMCRQETLLRAPIITENFQSR